MAAHPTLQAALNVRQTENILEKARGLHWSLFKFDADYEGRADRIGRALRGSKTAPDGLYHEGGFGVEPILYIVGETAQAVVAKAGKLAGHQAGKPGPS
jgi:XRE family transcriptional regulator, thiamine biosynthesis regulator